MKILIGKILAALLIVAAFFSLGIFIGCNTLKVYKVKGQPDPCNDMYTTMDHNIKTKNANSNLVALQWQDCKEARIEIHNRDCARWIFKDGKVNKKKFPEYGYYLECEIKPMVKRAKPK